METEVGFDGRRAVYTGMPAETRYGYAQAVQVGDLIHVSGQAGLGPDGELVAPAPLDAAGRPTDVSGMEAQMQAAYAWAERTLAELGGSLADVVQETLFVLDVPAAFAAGGVVRKKAYASERPQVASNLIGTPRLALPGQLIEIAFVAILTPDAPRPPMRADSQTP